MTIKTLDRSKQIKDANGDRAEVAYWYFDARRKGYDQWKLQPQSERAAFKAEHNIAYNAGYNDAWGSVMPRKTKNGFWAYILKEIGAVYVGYIESAEAGIVAFTWDAPTGIVLGADSGFDLIATPYIKEATA